MLLKLYGIALPVFFAIDLVWLGLGAHLITGGDAVVGWERHTERIWRSRLAGRPRFTTFSENGVRARPARWPKSGWPSRRRCW